MSKNITIQEGGTAKQMTVNKLKTTLVAGGTCLWVPEDEVSLGTKHITENGTYTASEDGKYGYSQVVVNVPGGAGSADSSGTPTTSGGTTPGGIGSAVVGTDPTDGNEYGVGVDENGNLVTTKIPSSISVGKAPDKTNYIDGETIDYSGIIVTLKGGDGEPFANSDYPNGRVPFDELTFPINNADISGVSNVGNVSYNDVNYKFCRTFTKKQYTENNDLNREVTFSAGYGVMFIRQGYKIIAVSKNAGSYTYTFGDGLYLYNENLNGVSGHKNLEARDGYYIDENLPGNHWADSLGWFINTDPSFLNDLANSVDNISNFLAGTITSESGGQTIPIKWTSPYDGRTFETTFDIIVTASSNSNNESSGGEGGGGGHSF